MAHFAYEEAERVLHQFAAGARPRAFKRAYRKFIFMVMAHAYCDYFQPSSSNQDKSRKEAVAKAWEDAQLAFTGHGESALTGAVLQMLSTLEDDDLETFYTVVRTAFQKAEAATPKDAVRLYLTSFRTKPPRRREEPFNLQIILPMSGVKLREWALDSGEDVNEQEESWAWIELGDRLGSSKDVPKVTEKKPRRRKLKLVENE